MANTCKVVVNWVGIEYRPFVITDLVIPGTTIAQSLPDDRLDYYELEKQFFDDSPDEWSNTEKLSVTQVQLSADFERAVKVRIRAVLRDGSRTAWAYSNWFPLYGFEAFFTDYLNNSIFLGIV